MTSSVRYVEGVTNVHVYDVRVYHIVQNINFH